MSDRVAVMKNGRILQLDTPATLFQRPASKEVACFVGSPRINILSLPLHGESSTPEQITFAPRTAVEIGVRPHHFLWHADIRAWPLKIRVHSVEYAGSEKIVVAKTENQELITVVADAMQPVQEGEAHTLYIEPTRALFFDAQGVCVEA